MNEIGQQPKKTGVTWKGGVMIIGVLLLFGWLVDDFDPDKAKREGLPIEPKGWENKPVALPGLGNFAVQLPADADRAVVEGQARALCGDKTHCSVYGWVDPANVARAMPMLDREVAALTFSYSLNRTTGFERALWDCRRFAGLPADSCLSK